MAGRAEEKTKHLGDITKINGCEIEPADVVVGGSPCQGLSIAGQRLGLADERSGLFMEQTRIVKEMRKADGQRGRTDVLIRPRYMVWENVPGAFSSSKGEDFRIVLEETAKIKDETTIIHRPPKGKWGSAGSIVADGWSIAWRVMDAQFFGTPQRRRRIALVADFGGQSAAEILFEPKGVCRDIAKSKTEGKTITTNIGGGVVSTDGRLYAEFTGNQGFQTGGISYIEDRVPSLRANQITEVLIYCLQGNGIERSDTAGCNGKGWREDKAYTLNTVDKHTVFDTRGNGNGTIIPTITGDHENRITNTTTIVIDYSKLGLKTNKTGTLQIKNDSNENADYISPVTIYGFRGFGDYTETDKSKGLLASDDVTTSDLIKDSRYVRRLTPLECERLQGYPDGWTNLPDVKDTPRYKALGNSIALPQWAWLLQRISDQYNYVPSLGSLFDGIGGFPLIWERINGNGTAVWASEIEKFPMRVTNLRFGSE